MRKKITLLIMSCLLYMNGYAQTPFWSDSFEDTGSPSNGTRNSPAAFTTNVNRIFNRTNTAGVDIVGAAVLGATYSYSGIDGTKFWAGEDTDNGGTVTAANVLKTVTWSINISGKSNIKLKGLFAAGNTVGNGYENGTASSTGVNDYMSIQYSIDGGSIQNLLSFYPLANAASNLYPDTDFDGNGDPSSIALNNTLTEFIGNVSGTGTTLTLYMNMSMTGSAEEVAIDNLRLVEVPSCVPPVITGNPPNRTICAGSNTTFPSSATGATGYQWQVDMGSGFTDLTNIAPYSNVTTNTLAVTGATAEMSSYLYRCIAYNPTIACFTNSNSATLTVSSISTATGSQTSVSCFGGTNGSASVTPSGGIAPYSYSWSPSGGTGATASGLAAGTYTVTVTDNILCTATRVYTITQPAAVVSGTTVETNVSCFGGTNGAINLTPTGGTGPYTFSWGGGITTEDRTGLAAGTYSVTITDINGCTGTVSGIAVNQPAAVVSGTTVVTNVSCNSGTNGAINLTPTGGTGPYTFSWGGGITTEDRTGLAAGTYSVTITDINGCTGTVSGIAVNQPAAAVSGTTLVTNISCNSGTNGAINLTPTGGTGPYTFSWGGGITTEDRTGLAAGTYSVTITDANGCTGTVSGIAVNQPAAAVSGTTVVTNVSCNSGTNGAINLTPTGGTGPYTFSWGGGITTEDRTGLAAGTYSVTITDINGCTGTVSGIAVNQPAAAVSGTTVVTNVSCNSGTNGAINLTPTGGTGPYTFSWGGGITAEDRTGLAAGTYSVIITDVNGCTGTVSGITVTAPTAISTATGSQTNVACNGGTTGSASVSPSGGTPGYTYSWSPSGGTAATATGLAAGSYTVTVTDANGCKATRNYTITQPTAISTATGSQTNVACNGGSNGTASVSPSGGTPGYTYSWSPSGGTAATATGLAAGSYTVTVTDANGCTATRNYTITQPTAISTATGSQTNVACNGGSNGTASVSPSGGTPGYTYSWSPSGGTAATATGLAAGSYTVTVTDANGCKATRNYTITQPTAISTATGSQTNVACNGGSNGTASVSPSGGTPGYTYSWSPSGGTAATATGLAAGNYTVTVTDANGCTATRTYTITQPAALISTATLAGGTITADQSGATYQWIQCPATILVGENGQSYTPTAIGSYAVVITVGSCSTISSCILVNTLANPNFEEKAKFIMYPNPSKGVLNIESDHDSDLNITNQLGQTIKTAKVTSDTINTINIESFADGVYFITEKKGSKLVTHKLILKK